MNRNQAIVACAAALTALTVIRPAEAQQVIWERTYGGVYNEGGASGARLADGGYVLVGSTFSFGKGDHDIYLVRTDSLGETVWWKTYGGADTEHGYDIQPTVDGGFVFCGVTRSTGAGKGDVCLMKVDSLGILRWSRTFGGAEKDVGNSVQQTPDGGFVIGGTTSSFGAGFNDMYLIKTDSLGILQWSKTFGGSGGESGSAVRLTPDGALAFVGSTGSFGPGYSNVYLVKVSLSGDSIWAKTYGGPGAAFGYSLENARGAGLAIVGGSSSFGDGSVDLYVARVDLNGFLEWERSFGGRNDDRGNAIRETPDGGFLVAGTTESYGAGKIDIYALRVDAFGGKIWSDTYGGANSDYCNALLADEFNNVVMVGQTYSFSNGGSDMYVAKVKGDLLTDVQPVDEPALPASFALGQNYPNPFNPSTTIPFSLSKAGYVTLEVYNVLGQKVETLVDEDLSAGAYNASWDAGSYSSGVYFYRLRTAEFVESRKMALVK